MNEIVLSKILSYQLHDRRLDSSHFNSTLELRAVTEDGEVILCVCHNFKGDSISAQLESLGADFSKLTINCELKERSSDHTSFYLISDYSFSGGQFESFEQMESYVDGLLNENDKVPLYFEFVQNVHVTDLMRSPSSSLLVAVERANLTNGKSYIFLESKPNSKTAYNLKRIPFLLVSNIYYHPDYTPTNEILEKGVYTSHSAFDNAIKSIIPSGTSMILSFRFTTFIKVLDFSIEPIDHLEVEVKTQKLQYPGDVGYPEYVTISVKPGSRSFYLTKHFPYHLCSEIIESAYFNPSVYISTSKTSTSKKAALKIDKTKGDNEQNPNEVPLYEILEKSKSKIKDRNHESCIICGKKIKAKEPKYVHLSSQGNLVNTLELEYLLHFDFFKIGKECINHLPDGFTFTHLQIETFTSNQLEESNTVINI